MNKILVPVDFSGNTANATKVACDLARKMNCGIILLHSYFELIIWQSLSAVPPEGSVNIAPFLEPDLSILRSSSEHEMSQLVQQFREECTGIQLESVVTALELKEVVTDICTNNQVLIIVMGTTGTGKKDSFSGSAASLLFDCTPVPILAVPESYEYMDGFGNALYATSFAEAAQSEVRFILDHFTYPPNKVHCCHLRFSETDDLLDNAQMHILSQPFTDDIQAGRVSFEIMNTTRVETTLYDLVTQRNIGLISFHEHNRSAFYRLFHKSIRKEIYRFNIPLLVFRKF